jgi:hypothetical protein
MIVESQARWVGRKYNERAMERGVVVASAFIIVLSLLAIFGVIPEAK